MAHSVKLTEIARRDLEAIVRYIAFESPQRAQAFGAFLLDKTAVLSTHPRMGRVVPEFGLEHLRELQVRRHRIIYRLKDGANQVEVLRFWHAARGSPELSV